MSKSLNKLLTEVEQELMLVLWKLGEGSVHEVLASLPDERNMAYTSASTIIRILEKKGFVKSRKQGKAHIYSPLIAKNEYESTTLGHVMDKLFDNTPVSLVARLVDTHDLTADDIADIKMILENRK